MHWEHLTLHYVLGQRDTVALDQIDLELAKLCQQFSEGNKEVQRKIWLKIAR